MTNISLEHTAIQSLKRLTNDDVESTYSGKPGCMCGCRGKYYHELNRFVVAHMIDMIGGHKATEIAVNERYIYAANDFKVYAVYLKERQ